MTEEQVIVARGKSAVRGLKLHLGSIADLERRSRVFLARCDGDEDESKAEFPITMALEEVVGRCRVLQEQVLSSIENWTDIVPEADIKTQIGEITRLAQENDEQLSEVRRLKAELADSKNQSAATQASLQAELEKKEKVLKETQRKLAESRSSLGSFVSSPGTLMSGGLSVLSGSALLSFERTCIKCGKHFKDDMGSSLVFSRLCPECMQGNTFVSSVTG